MLLLGAAIAAGAAVSPQLASASPDSTPKAPTIASVQKRLGLLALKSSQLVEQYDHARVVAQQRKVTADKAVRAAAAAQVQLNAASDDMSRTLTAEYEGTPMSAAGALLTSSSDVTYLDQMNSADAVSEHTTQVVDHMAQSKQTAQDAVASSKKMLAQATAQLAAVRLAKTKVQKQIDKYQTLLATLTATQRAAYNASANPSVSATKIAFVSSHLTASAREMTAVRFALAQVGKPYVFGAAGPDAYDCSGLTMASWAAAGVSLPHSAADQYGYGTHVSLSNLTPGDLIFMYSPIGHVTIYIGDGMMVSAPQSGQDVSVIPVTSFSGSIVGATHIA
jgi:cell wall-associated NlpC family hydrolase